MSSIFSILSSSYLDQAKTGGWQGENIDGIFLSNCSALCKITRNQLRILLATEIYIGPWIKEQLYDDSVQSIRVIFMG